MYVLCGRVGMLKSLQVGVQNQSRKYELYLCFSIFRLQANLIQSPSQNSAPHWHLLLAKWVLRPVSDVTQSNHVDVFGAVHTKMQPSKCDLKLPLFVIIRFLWLFIIKEPSGPDG